MIWRTRFGALCTLGCLMFSLAGCRFSSDPNAEQQKERDEKTRQEAEKATERAKPELEAAGRAIGRAAQTAAEDARAAAQGIKEGWKQGGHALVDVNAASETELESLPGITSREARRIIKRRPYQAKHELVLKGALTESSYEKIQDEVTVK
jgi:competence protein ComEA